MSRCATWSPKQSPPARGLRSSRGTRSRGWRCRPPWAGLAGWAHLVAGDQADQGAESAGRAPETQQHGGSPHPRHRDRRGEGGGAGGGRRGIGSALRVGQCPQPAASAGGRTAPCPPDRPVRTPRLPLYPGASRPGGHTADHDRRQRLDDRGTPARIDHHHVQARASMAACGDHAPMSGVEYDHLIPPDLGGAVNEAGNLRPAPDHAHHTGLSPTPRTSSTMCSRTWCARAGCRCWARRSSSPQTGPPPTANTAESRYQTRRPAFAVGWK
jgi:hypothetical protein